MAQQGHRDAAGGDGRADIDVASVLAGRYVVTGKLGAGGMGVVFEARDRERDVPVALKMLPSSDAKWLAQFKQEFRALADVVHPNLVTMYELVADQDQFFFTMELIDGVSFLRYVRPLPAGAAAPDSVRTLAAAPVSSALTATRETASLAAVTAAALPGARPGRGAKPRRADPGELDLERLRECLRQLAAAVAAIHQAGMLHRDLKPSNVLVTRDGRLVVLDFGLITATVEEDAQSVAAPRAGTVAYMAPEQATRDVLTEACDWYAVGGMLYQALTGYLPYSGGMDDILLDKQQHDPPPPNQVACGIPDDLNELCVDLLCRDPSGRPSGDEVLDRLATRPFADRPPAPASPAIPSELVGRASHREALDAAYAATKRGRAVVTFVRGDSGMGKTALVRSFLESVSDEAIVLRGRCYERESVPFKAVDNVVDALAGYLSRLSGDELDAIMPANPHALVRVFPVLRQIEALGARPRRQTESSDAHVLRWQAFGALRDLLIRTSRRGPLIVAVDDLQWGDVDSAELLAALVEPPDPPPLLLLGCCRADDVAADSFLEVFTRRVEEYGVVTRTVDVGPLSAGDARALARSHLAAHREATGQIERIAAESAGSPFFVEELARYVQTTGESAGSLSLEGALRARVARLQAPARRLLNTVAVAARPIPQDLAFAASGVSDPAVLSVLKAEMFVRTSSAAGERHVEAYHDRVRSAVVAMLPGPELCEYHLQLASAVEATPSPDAEALAIHYHGAGRDDRAAHFAELAARRHAASLAFDQAARLYRMALALTSDAGARGCLQAALAEVLSNAGRSAEAAAAYLAAIDAEKDEQQAIELKRRAAEELLHAGRLAEGLVLLDQLLDSIGVRVPGTPRRAIASLLASRARLAVRGLDFKQRAASELAPATLRQLDTMFAVATCLGPVDAIRAAALGTKHLLLSLATGEPSRVVQGLASEACFVSVKGVRQRERTRKIFVRLQDVADKVGTPEAFAFVHGARGISHFQFGDWVKSYDHCAAARELFRDYCTGYSWEETTATLYESYALAFLGRLPELHDLVDDSLRRAEERGDRYLDTSLRFAVRFYRHAENDDPDAAIAEIDRALAVWSNGRFDAMVWIALLAYFVIDNYADEPERGIARHHAYWTQLKRSQLWASQVLRSHHQAFLGRLYLRAGVRAGSNDQLGRARRAAKRLARAGAGYTDGFAALLRAGLAAHAGNEDAALADLEVAEARFADTSMRLNEAACQVRRGQLLGGEAGAELIAAGTQFCRDAGLSNVSAVVRAICPGFEASG